LADVALDAAQGALFFVERAGGFIQPLADFRDGRVDRL